MPALFRRPFPRPPGFAGFTVAGGCLAFRTSILGLRILGLAFKILGLASKLLGFGFWIWGFGFWVLDFGISGRCGPLKWREPTKAQNLSMLQCPVFQGPLDFFDFRLGPLRN